jgi:serine/threonine protein kinase
MRRIEDDSAYIVTELPEGDTLRSFIEQKGTWTMKKTLQLMNPLMKSLEKKDDDDVACRDISPDKLIVMQDGNLRLLDFDNTDQRMDITLTSLAAGSCYTPPEKLDVKGVSGSWSDVYSVCAVIYYCITGSDPEDAVSRLLLDDLRKPSELDADITSSEEKTLMRGMTLDSKERIQDIIQLQQSFMLK